MGDDAKTKHDDTGAIVLTTPEDAASAYGSPLGIALAEAIRRAQSDGTVFVIPANAKIETLEIK